MQDCTRGAEKDLSHGSSPFDPLASGAPLYFTQKRYRSRNSTIYNRAGRSECWCELQNRPRTSASASFNCFAVSRIPPDLLPGNFTSSFTRCGNRRCHAHTTRAMSLGHSPSWPPSGSDSSSASPRLGGGGQAARLGRTRISRHRARSAGGQRQPPPTRAASGRVTRPVGQFQRAVNSVSDAKART